MLLENRKLGCQSPQWAAWDDSRADTRVLVPVPDNKNILGTPEKGPGWGRSVFMVQVMVQVCLHGAGHGRQLNALQSARGLKIPPFPKEVSLLCLSLVFLVHPEYYF